MKKAINVKKGREATTNEVIKFAFLNAVKNVAIELQESRQIDLGNDVSVFIEENELHHIDKVANAFIKKYGECSEIVTGKIQTKVEIITD
jgi:hypothetical protein